MTWRSKIQRNQLLEDYSKVLTLTNAALGKNILFSFLFNLFLELSMWHHASISSPKICPSDPRDKQYSLFKKVLPSSYNSSLKN